MFWYVLGSVVAMVICTLLWMLRSEGSDYENNSLDAFIDISTKVVQSAGDESSKYYPQYEDPGKQVLLLYGTEYGFTEEVTRFLFDRIVDVTPGQDDLNPWQPRMVNMRDYEHVDFTRERIVLILVSTAGDGVPPTDARPFVESLSGNHTSLSHLYYSVLAMGDSNYPNFCQCGNVVDQRLSEKGGTELTPRSNVDREDWSVIETWTEQVISEIQKVDIESTMDYLQVLPQDTDVHGYTRNRPFDATLKMKYCLTEKTDEDDKETFHCEFDLTNSGLTWTAGDALGVYPLNHPDEVQELLDILHVSGKEPVPPHSAAYSPKPDGNIPLVSALTKYYDLKNVKVNVLDILRTSGSSAGKDTEALDNLLQGGMSKKNEILHAYLNTRELRDILRDFKDFIPLIQLETLLAALRPLQPRYYSISSSPLIDSNTACLTVASVRYNLHDIPRTGVASTYLCDRIQASITCPVFMSHNPHFRLPSDPSCPVLMIGPGTGLAPFRAFIQERVQAKANSQVGPTILYFGCRHKNKDFLYKNELEDWEARDHLTLRVAFSRDQKHKIYVQDLIREDASNIGKLLQENVHVYVCGDAKHMAHDVHQALLDVIKSQPNIQCSPQEFLTNLENTGRYQKDVWVV